MSPNQVTSVGQDTKKKPKKQKKTNETNETETNYQIKILKHK